MATERVSLFLDTRDIHVMYQLTKDELHSVAEEFGVSLEGDKKEELQVNLKTFLENKGWLPGDREENCNDGEKEAGDGQKGLMNFGNLEGLSGTEKYELMKLQLQMQMQMQTEIEKEKIRAEVQIQKEQIEKEKIRAQVQNLMQKEQTERERIKAGSGNGVKENKDGEKRVKYVPEFVEGEEENFFLQFEKTARLREWSEEDWALLVQSKFKGKAREAYVNLSDQEAGDYESIKEAVLKSTRLSPGVYRERFRNVKKRPGDTYLEMARQCCLKMDRWMKAEEVETIEEMREVFLMEHFMDQLPPNLKYELISHEVKDVMEAGRRADNYCEAHGLNKGDPRGGKKHFSNENVNAYKYKNNYQINSRPYYKFNQPWNNNYNYSQKYNQPPQHHYNLRPAPPKKWQGGSLYYQKDGGSNGAVKCLGCGTTGIEGLSAPRVNLNLWEQWLQRNTPWNSSKE